MSRWAALAATVVLVAVESVLLGAADELRAPWSGIVLGTIAAVLVALGWIGRAHGVLLGIVVTAAVTACWAPPWQNTTVEQLNDCDPSCGVTNWGLILVVLVPAAVVGLAGTLAGMIARRLRRAGRREPAGPRSR